MGLLGSRAVVSSPPPPAPESPASPADPLIGLQVGEYRILEPVGEGGMGVVYRGVQPIIKKRVAIKVLKPAHASDASQVQRLVAEAEAVNAIGHRSIIDIFSLGTLPDGRPYIIMEYLDGEPLDTWLSRLGRPPMREALSLLLEVCGPLTAAHKAGVIHRDLKPSNIFLCKQADGSRFLKLLDFGLAKRAMGIDGSSAQTSQGLVSGTPDYMAPEQARALPISPRSDIYALGVVAFELLTGQVPFTGATAMDVMVGHVSKPPPRLRTFEPELPAALDGLIARMLAKEPHDRPQTVEEVRAVLQDVLAAGDAPARTSSQPSLPRVGGPARGPGRPTTDDLPAPPQALPVIMGNTLDSSMGPELDMTPLAEVAMPPRASPGGPRRPMAPGPTPSAPRPPPRSSTSGARLGQPLPPTAPARPPMGSGSGLRAARTPASSRPTPPARSGGGLWVAALVAVLALAGLGAWRSGVLGPGRPKPTPEVEAPPEPITVRTPVQPAPPEVRRPKVTPPSSAELLARIAQLRVVAKKQKLPVNALSVLDSCQREATPSSTDDTRDTLARTLDVWESTHLKR